MAESAAVVVGIDLGTTNSSVGVFRNGSVEILPNSLGEPLTPSVVAWDEREGSMVVGRTAKEILLVHPDRGAMLFKREMGLDRRHPVGGQRLSPVELSALLLRSLRRDAEAALGESVGQAVITVPAYFDDSQRFATLKAGEVAGLGVVRILNEPTAAAIAHGVHERESDGMLMVLDLGGGTFDVCLMERFQGVLEVRSVAGDSRLGGEDFTRALAGLALSRVNLAAERVEASDPEAWTALVRRAELLKRRFTDVDVGAITLPEFQGRETRPTEVEIRREEAEGVWSSLLDRMLGPIRRSFTDAGLHRSDVQELLLVGGATRMACVRALVWEVFQCEPVSGTDPDLAVATGAAIQGALHLDHAAVGDFVVTDVISHSLGIEVVKDLDGRQVPGFFMPMIHRNTVIPTSRADIFTPVHPSSTAIDLVVYEGEARRAEENRRVGKVKVSDIPRSPAEREVDVRFTYDLNGILEVEATVLATGKRTARIFSRDGKALCREELEAAAARLAGIKEDPRVRPRLRDLLARAEALLREAPPEIRWQVEVSLDALEAAILSRNENRIRAETSRLREVCEEIDGGERW